MIQLADFQNEITLSEQDKNQGFWFQDDVHMAHAVSPLFASFQIPAMTVGTKKAFENLKAPMGQYVAKLSEGRIYQQMLPYPGDQQARSAEHQAFVKPLWPVLKRRMQDYVETEFLPIYGQLEHATRTIATLEEARRQLLALHDFYKRAWQLHFEIVMPRTSLTMELEHLYTQLTGDAQSTYVYELLTGVMNKTLETNRGLWKLAQAAKASPALQTLLLDVPASELKQRLVESPEGRAYLTQLQSFLDEYGYRTAYSHEFIDEIWVENPTHALSIIANYLQKTYDFDEEFNGTIRERESKAQAVLARMPEGEQKRSFLTLYQWALDSWGLDEDHHFYIDAMLPAKSRLFFLRVGDLLVQAGALSDRQEIFYLYLDELVGLLQNPAPAAQLIGKRKQEYQENKQKKAVPFYGSPPSGAENDPVQVQIFGTQQATIDEQKQTFSGYAASKGEYTGIVKVVWGPEDFAKVQKGDILVCRTTTPPWTVLFSVVGAVVTDAGGILSHAGTVAREYKLPSVVGTKVATSILQDGDIVTVDGTNGVVHFGRK